MTFSALPLQPAAPPVHHALADGDLPSMAALLMQSRQTILPRRLGGAGPTRPELEMILNAAACAPDHGRLLPWRFVLVPQASRHLLADVFGKALLERDSSATPEQVEQAREKAYRAPLLMLVVIDGGRGDLNIDLFERLASAGCAVQNMLLMATAMGFGSALTSGKALKSGGLRALFDLDEGEHALCFVSMGTAQSRKPPHLRPSPDDYTSILTADGVTAGL